MIKFEKNSLKNILILFEILYESSLLNKEFIENKYIKSASNFKETLNFLIELDLIKIETNNIIYKFKYNKFLKRFKELKSHQQEIKEFLIDCLLVQKKSITKYIIEFLSKFEFIDEHYKWNPSTQDRLKYSGMRNLLIELDFLYFDNDTKQYIISDTYTLTFPDIIDSYKISQSEFLKLMQLKAQIGNNAELQVIQFEKERLSKFPQIAEKIEHTAIKDVKAGYDIKSYDGKFDDNGNPILRYIEVKAVSRLDYKFNWTKNEIEKAKLFHLSYYLYLVPVLKTNKFDVENIMIIRDPYKEVCKSKNKWIRIEELSTFLLFQD